MKRDMHKTAEYRGIAKVFWSGRSQAVRLPAACRFDTSEVEVIKEGDCLTMHRVFAAAREELGRVLRGSLPARREPPLDERDGIR